MGDEERARRTLLEVLDVAAGEGNANAVDLDGSVLLELLRLHRRHVRLRTRAQRGSTVAPTKLDRTRKALAVGATDLCANPLFVVPTLHP